jgi:WhiB family transcriptional regulator, redox-sensing transcriptional regulator
VTGDCLDCGVDIATVLAGGQGRCNTCYQRAKRRGEIEVLPPYEAFVEVDLSWREDALCAETDLEIFFPEKGESTREGKSVCAECLVRAECLDYALETRQRFGIWGGCSERERRELLGLADDDPEEASAA